MAEYFIKPDGDDGKPGASIADAWRTLARINSGTQPDDIINLACDGVWRETLSPSRTFHFRPYGSGNKPRIMGSDLKNTAAQWTNEGSNLWYLSGIGSDPKMFFIDNALGNRKISKTNLIGQWDYWYDSVNSRFYIYSTANPAILSGALELAMRNYCLELYHGDSIFEDIDFRHCTSELVLGWGANNSYFNECDFYQSPGNALQFHNGSNNGLVYKCKFSDWGLIEDNRYAVQVIKYGVAETGPVDLRGCEFTATRPLAGTDCTAVMQDDGGWIREISACRINGAGGNVRGDGFVIWYSSSSAISHLLEKNWIEEIGGIGLTIQDIGHYSATPTVIIRKNRIQDVCQSNVFDKSAVRLRGYTAACDVRMYQNIINGTAVGANAQPGIKNSGASGTKFWNNLITRTDNAVVVEDGDVGHSLGVELRNGTMANNRDWGLMLRPGNTLVAFDHNLFYGNGSGSASGINLGSTNIEADPRFINPNSDFKLQADSPCINRGADVGLLDDIEGTPIPQGQGADIGPYKYTGEIMATHSIDVILRVLELADFAMGATPADLSVQRTKTGTYSVTATAVGGFSSAITLSVAGVPANASFSFSKNPILPGETSVFSITPANNTPLGNFTLSFTGNG